MVFAEPDNVEAKNLQADTFEQLGYGAENGTWRNFYLTGAYELRNGSVGTPTVAAAPDITAALSVSQVFDAVSLRVDGVRAAGSHIVVDWNITDENIVHRTELSNGVLIHFDIDPLEGAGSVDATFGLSRRDFTRCAARWCGHGCRDCEWNHLGFRRPGEARRTCRVPRRAGSELCDGHSDLALYQS